MNTISDDEFPGFVAKILDHPQLIYVTSLFAASGSLFVYSLLDGHPHLYTFPWHVDKYIDLVHFDPTHWKQYLDKILQSATFFNTSIRDVSTQGDGLDQLGAERNQGIKTDKARFIYFVNKIFQDATPDRHTFTLGIILAYNFAHDRFIPSNKFALYTHDVGRALDCQHFLGNGIVIATSRHPASIHASVFKRNCRVNQELAILPPPPELSPFRHFYEFTKLSRGSLKLLLLEELHANPEPTLQALAKSLDIPFTQSLMQSTFGGLAWWGIKAATLNGFSKTLHKQLPLALLGKNLENIIFQMTRTFQCSAGYARTDRISGFDSVMFYFLDKMFFTYFLDLAKALVVLAKKKTFLGKFLLAGQTMSLLATHLIQTTRNYRLKIRLRRLDRNIRLETIELINPLQAQSLELIRK